MVSALGSFMKKVFFLFLGLILSTSVVAAELPVVHIKDVNAMLEKHVGKVVLLNFFATWCPPCRQEIPELVNVHKKFTDKQILFVGLSVDDQKDHEKVNKFIRDQKIPYAVYQAGRDLLLRFGINSIPHNVFYDTKGKMVISQPGQCDAEDVKLVIEDLLHAK